MSPVVLIYMMFYGSILVISLAIIWFIFRKKKKIALTVTIISVVVFVLFFSLRPYYVKLQHSKRYAILEDYLQENYPEYKFEITPKLLEDGYRPYEYRVVANGYKYRNEIYQVESDNSIINNSYYTLDYANEEDLDYLLLNSVYNKPFEYFEKEVALEELTRYEDEDFLVRLMLIDGQVKLYNFLKIEGQYFLEQSTLSNEYNYIEMNVSTNDFEDYYVLAILPGFDEEQWKNLNPLAGKIELKEETPVIYVVPN